MNLEFPMLTIASQLNQTLDGLSCYEVYNTNFGMSSDNANALCTSTGNFTFTEDD